MDFVTVLRTADSRARATKIIGASGVRAPPQTRIFRGREVAVDGIESLAAVLTETQRDPRSFIVRGAIAEGVDRQRMYRRSLPRVEGGKQVAPTLVEVPHHWVLLDIDDLPAAAGCDPLDIATALAEVERLLPPCFAGATVWHTFTASAGFKKGINLRLAYWLDRRLGERELKRWLAGKFRVGDRFQKEYPVDSSLFQTAQQHFIAPPIFEDGVIDPFAGRMRSGLIVRQKGFVEVPPIPDAPTRVSRAASGARVATDAATFETALDAIGDDREGFYEPAKRAVAIFWSTNAANADEETMLARLAGHMRSAQRGSRSTHDVEERIASLRGFSAWVRDQEKARRETARTDFDNAICPWPEEGIVLAEAETRLREVISEAFAALDEDRLKRVAFAERDRARACDFASLDDDMDASPLEFPQIGVKVTPGAGKTHAAIEAAIEAASRGFRTVIAVPTHDKAEEIAALADRLAGRKIAGVWQGVKRDDPEEPWHRMCRRPATEALEAGLRLSQLCGDGACPFFAECAMQKQMARRTAITVAPTALLASKIPGVLADADILVIDEKIDVGEAKEKILSLADITEPRGFEAEHPDRQQLRGAIDRLSQGLAAHNANEWVNRDKLVAAELTTGLCERASQREWGDYTPVVGVATADDATLLKFAKEAGLRNAKVALRRALWQELAALLQSTGDSSSARLQVRADRSIAMNLPPPIHPSWFERRILHIDATLAPRVARARLPRLELKADIRVARGDGVRVRQVVDAPVSYRKVVPGARSGDRAAQENVCRSLLWRCEVAACEERARHGADAKTALIAPKGVVQWIKRDCKARGSDPSFAFAHFGALRGLNSLAEVSRLIVFSRQEPSPFEVERDARSLLGRHPSSSLGEAFYPRRPVALRRADRARTVIPETFHPDPDCDAYLRQIRNAEVEQAVHRARPCRRGTDRPLQIDIVTATPIDLTIDETTTVDDWLAEAPVDALLTARGVMPDTWAGKHAVLADRFPSPQAVRRAAQEERRGQACRGVGKVVAGVEAAKGAQTPYREAPSTLIRRLGTFRASWPSFDYKVHGERKAHRVAIDPAVGDPRTAWGRYAGELDLFEPASGLSKRTAERKHTAPSLFTDQAAPTLRPDQVLHPVASVAGDLLAVRRFDGAGKPIASAAPLPIAPLHVRTTNGAHFRSWAAEESGEAITLIQRPAPPARTFRPEEIADRLGISRGAYRFKAGQARFAKLPDQERGKALVAWMAAKVGAERFQRVLAELRAA